MSPAVEQADAASTAPSASASTAPSASVSSCSPPVDSSNLQTPSLRVCTAEELLSPHVLVEEAPEESGRQRLRVTFASPALDASDASLEVGEQAVRLSSTSNAWK